MLLAGCSLTGAAEPDSSSVSGQASHTEAKTSDITVPGTEPMQTESATVTIDASGEGTNRMFYAHAMISNTTQIAAPTENRVILPPVRKSQETYRMCPPMIRFFSDILSGTARRRRSFIASLKMSIFPGNESYPSALLAPAPLDQVRRICILWRPRRDGMREDGLVEATNQKSELFGMDRVLETLNRHPEASPEQTLKELHRAVDDFVEDAPQFDDLTMLCLHYIGINESGTEG